MDRDLKLYFYFQRFSIWLLTNKLNVALIENFRRVFLLWYCNFQDILLEDLYKEKKSTLGLIICIESNIKYTIYLLYKYISERKKKSIISIIFQ